jgi:hypothetical protein
VKKIPTSISLKWRVSMNNPLDRFILMKKGEAKIITKEIDKSFISRKVNPCSISGFLNNSHKNLPPSLFFKYIFKPYNKGKFDTVKLPKVNRRFS